MDIKVLGPGCARCNATVDLIGQVAQETGRPVSLEKVEDMRQIMGWGVMSTPGVVVDGKVVHRGSVPSRDQVLGWLAGGLVAQHTCGCGGSGAAPAGGCC